MSSPPALASSPAAAQPLPPWRPHCRRIVPRPPSASRPSSILAHGASARCRSQPQPRLVAAQSHPPPPLPDAGAARRNAETGLALLLVVLAAVMSCFLSLTILSFAASRTLQKLETTANKLVKVVADEAHGTLSSLKLSFLEINDLTSQLTNLRKRLTISRFGNEASTKASFRTGWPKQGNK
ncbi:unnamed protein product [Urochloa decumbens]|uniref:Uncharacterized protein n=1 Tax=Urochloa decumbens TaxID=240449 RepID=A0ABC8WJ81_9POAL